MTAVYTFARALLAAEATALAAEATRAGLTSLATQLTGLSSEISSGSGGLGDAGFTGTATGDGALWAQILSSAASTIKTKISNDVAGYTNAIQQTLSSIDAHIASQTTAINSLKTDLDTIAANSTTIKNLAEGTGIHMIGPYDWLGFASIYHLYVEQGKLIDESGNVSEAEQAAALARLETYIEKVRSLPTLY